MSRASFASLVCVAWIGHAALACSLAWADPAEHLRLGKPHRLQVTHTTRVRVAPDTARLLIWQARPIDRVWPGQPAPLGVVKATVTPAGAKEVPTRSAGGLAWQWELADPVAGDAVYVTLFEVLSADRELKTAGLEIAWADLPADTTEIMKGLPSLPTASEALREVVSKTRRKERDVIGALGAFAQWVNQNIAYVPGVAYPTDDLAAICKGRAGHCGHRATAYLALCQAAGIPARRVVGYALLNHPAGAGGDDGNRHVWVQVHLPTMGWVEVEPAPRGSPFAISHLYVMCPLDLQSRVVSATSKGGARSMPLVSDTLRVVELR